MENEPAERVNIHKLVTEANSNPELITIEGTVDTGFEFLGLQECKERFGQDINAFRSRGRIFFNISLTDLNRVTELRSVDNLYLVAATVEDFKFNQQSKEEDLEIVKELAKSLDLKKSLNVWKKYASFFGVVYPTLEQFKKSVELKEQEKAIATNEVNENPTEDSQNENNECDLKFLSDLLKFRATCNRAGKHSFTSMDAARDFGGQIQDNYNWVVDLTNYNLEVVLNISEHEGYVCFALTKYSLHRRNITEFGPTTLRATSCYNMLRMAQLMPGDIVVDPLCGGGSIPIEGAIAFPSTFHVAGDIHEKAVHRTYLNVKSINEGNKGLELPLDIFQWDIGRLPLRTSSVDVFTTDLPFGKRSGRKSDNRPLYTKALDEMARVVRPETGRAVLLTHDKKTLIQVLSKTNRYWGNGWRPFNINLGGLEGGVFLLRRTAKVYL